MYLRSGTKNNFMSLLNNNNKKNKGKKSGGQPNQKASLIPSKGKANPKGMVRNTKLTGGSQRGS